MKMRSSSKRVNRDKKQRQSMQKIYALSLFLRCFYQGNAADDRFEGMSKNFFFEPLLNDKDCGFSFTIMPIQNRRRDSQWSGQSMFWQWYLEDVC